MPAATCARIDAPQLFLERARQLQPDFAPDESETSDLVRICQIVDGMPLALELAAAWADTLTLREIRRELEGSLGFLATDAAGVVDRHRSMEATFDASWQRLTEQEQRVFAQAVGLPRRLHARGRGAGGGRDAARVERAGGQVVRALPRR